VTRWFRLTAGRRELTGVTVSTVRTHLERGLAHLRTTLEVETMFDRSEDIARLIDAVAEPAGYCASHPSGATQAPDPTGHRSDGGLALSPAQ